MNSHSSPLSKHQQNVNHVLPRVDRYGSGLRVQGSEAQGVGFRAHVGCGVRSLGFWRVQEFAALGVGFRAQGLGFRGSRLGVWSLGPRV